MVNMNLCVVSPNLYPCMTGGLEIFNYYLIRELTRRGHHVWYATRCGKDLGFPSSHPIILGERNLVFPGISTTASLISSILRLRNEIDLLHVPYTSNSPLALPLVILHRLTGIPYVLYIHGGGMHAWKRPFLQKRLFRQAAEIVAVSEPIREEYEQRTGRRVRLIYPLIPFQTSHVSARALKERYGFGADDTLILSVGSLKRIKGSDTLLSAFLLLGASYIKEHGLRLVFAGEGVLRRNLEIRARESEVPDRITFLGNVPYERVSELYTMADLYIIPSLFEGTPKSLLEAMYHGLRIIGSDTNGINDKIIHGKEGLLFPTDSVEDLRDTLIRVLEDPASHELGARAREKYQAQYSFERTLGEIETLYTGILKVPE
jgi:glycosyltransferase involved in cell wall biosynthesis